MRQRLSRKAKGYDVTGVNDDNGGGGGGGGSGGAAGGSGRGGAAGGSRRAGGAVEMVDVAQPYGIAETAIDGAHGNNAAAVAPYDEPDAMGEVLDAATRVLQTKLSSGAITAEEYEQIKRVNEAASFAANVEATEAAEAASRSANGHASPDNTANRNDVDKITEL